ncbi:hypothetical protein T07_11530 [Trichinella nelsoni]|uniref:Uncharacterized protein n=1 Tax=Trichinella nelsoni TaxID=6336 RepID=A0A0V0SE27_9BILA|nr:hypothetical protein T07_11530 [Trichinella nelsoni]
MEPPQWYRSTVCRRAIADRPKRRSPLLTTRSRPHLPIHLFGQERPAEQHARMDISGTALNGHVIAHALLRSFQLFLHFRPADYQRIIESDHFRFGRPIFRTDHIVAHEQAHVEQFDERIAETEIRIRSSSIAPLIQLQEQDQCCVGVTENLHNCTNNLWNMQNKWKHNTPALKFLERCSLATRLHLHVRTVFAIGKVDGWVRPSSRNVLPLWILPTTTPRPACTVGQYPAVV